MFVKKIPILVMVSRHIKFTTVLVLNSRSAKDIVDSLCLKIEIYKCRGFSIAVCYMDPEFEAIKTKSNGTIKAYINTTAAKEHVPEVERQIRVIKEHVCAVCNTLLYNILPKLVVGYMVRYVVAWLNNLPPAGGVSTTASPRLIVHGTKLTVEKHCHIPFDAYAQIHEENT
jgi:hypothetical protein